MREGDRFGNYILEERIAVGGMAEVFRARREGAAGFSRSVCIKRILPALCDDPDFVHMFIDEARIGAQLRHGNIIGIEDFGEVDGQYFLCMELVSGVDLAKLSQRVWREGGPFPIDAALFVALEICKGLAYAHRKHGADGTPLNIVHRDVSPHNVLVSYAGEVKLTDFGIAKAASRLHHTAGTMVKGKLAYMAPEQALAKPIDARADLFSVGVLLFELIAGRRPFKGADEGEALARLIHGERPRLRALRPDVDPSIEGLVDRLLATEPDERVASADDVVGVIATMTVAGLGARTLAQLVAQCFPGAVTSAGAPARAARDSTETVKTTPDAARTTVDAASTPTPTAPGGTEIRSSSFADVVAYDPTVASDSNPGSTAPRRAGGATEVSREPTPMLPVTRLSDASSIRERASSSTDPTRTMAARVDADRSSRDATRQDPAVASRTPPVRDQREGRFAVVAGIVAFALVLLVIYVLLRATDRAAAPAGAHSVRDADFRCAHVASAGMLGSCLPANKPSTPREAT